jgi:hypothetical protein
MNTGAASTTTFHTAINDRQPNYISPINENFNESCLSARTKSLFGNDDQSNSSIGESDNQVKQDNEMSLSINNLSLNITVNLITFFAFGLLSYFSHWLAYDGGNEVSI